MVCLDFNTLTRDKIPAENHQSLQELIRPHLDSFNFMVKTGLGLAVDDLSPVE
eukprot:Awhi_evm1s972